MSKIKIQETNLPGVGIRRDFATDADKRIGVLEHHSGHMELLVYDDIDPDICRDSVHLTEEEGRMLGKLLGASDVVQSMSKIKQTIGGLIIDWIEVGDGWACADKRISALQLTRTGVLIVAVIRDGETTPIPSPDFEINAHDTVVVIGAPEGIKVAYRIMQGDG